mgnify:CR=1 FL=1
MLVKGVSKRWQRKRKSHPRAKKVWNVYFYDEDGRFRTKRISATQVLFYKAQIKKIRLFEEGATFGFTSLLNEKEKREWFDRLNPRVLE